MFSFRKRFIFVCEEFNMKIYKECKNKIFKEHKTSNYNDLKIQYKISVKNCKNFKTLLE